MTTSFVPGTLLRLNRDRIDQVGLYADPRFLNGRTGQVNRSDVAMVVATGPVTEGVGRRCSC